MSDALTVIVVLSSSNLTVRLLQLKPRNKAALSFRFHFKKSLSPYRFSPQFSWKFTLICK